MLTRELNIRVLQALFTDARFAALLKQFDRLHDAVVDGRLTEITNLDVDQVIGWLQDIGYTIDQTMMELKKANRRIQWGDYAISTENAEGDTNG